jgi:hypothetical protein
MKRQIKDTIAKTVISLIPFLKNNCKNAISPDLKSLKVFHFIGFDIMLDTNLKAWQFEINANPSMNMHLERELPNGIFEKKVSKIDKYLKTLVIETGIKIARATKPLEDYGIWEKILPRDEHYY